VPIVSAVGHEQDTPLCDLAADVRASTPHRSGKGRRPPTCTNSSSGSAVPAPPLQRSVRRSLERERQRLVLARTRLDRAPALCSSASARRSSTRTAACARCRRARRSRAATRSCAALTASSCRRRTGRARRRRGRGRRVRSDR
jgi:exodeoxyribonuclease VII large subunit